MNLMFNQLSFLDLWSSPFSVNFDKKQKRFSLIGIFLSLCIFAYLPYQFSRSQFILKEEPIVVRQTIEIPSSIPVQFDMQHPLAAYVVDITGKKYYDPTLFDVQISVYSFKTLENGTTIPINSDFKF